MAPTRGYEYEGLSMASMRGNEYEGTSMASMRGDDLPEHGRRLTPGRLSYWFPRPTGSRDPTDQARDRDEGLRTISRYYQGLRAYWMRG